MAGSRRLAAFVARPSEHPGGRWRPRVATVAVLGAAVALAAASLAWASPPTGAARSRARVGTTTTWSPSPASSVVSEPVQSPATEGWTTYGGNLFAQRYSGLSQITTANVHALGGAWTFHTGLFNSKTSFEATPVVVGDTMYITGPHSEVFALNATTGAKEWEYSPAHATRVGSLPLCCGQVNRGVAVGGGRVYVAQLNGQLVALDARTGAVEWATSVGSSRRGFSETAAPLYAGGRLYIGVSGAEYPMRGFMSAYDAATGRLLWRWYTIPGPGKVGHDTWPATNAWKTGGGSIWDTPALDPAAGLLYFGVGNPNPDLEGHTRPGNNLFTDSIVALHAGDGRLAWYYQEVHHDLWDYDATSPVVLFDATIDGRPVPGLAEAGKSGWVYLLNRLTGQPIHPIPKVRVPVNPWQRSSPTQPEPVGTAFVPHTCTMPGFPKAETFTPLVPGKAVFTCPGNSGGDEWSPSSYSPTTSDLYVCAIDEPMLFASHLPGTATPGKERWGSTLGPTELSGYTGNLTAVNVVTGTVAWHKSFPYPCIGGSLTTDGGLVFVGQSNGTLDALNAATGATLWQSQTGAGANAPPVTYAENGTQYVAIASGGSKSQATPPGDTLWAFRLGGQLPQAPAPKVTLPKMYATSITIGAAGPTPSTVFVGICQTLTWHNDTAYPATVTIGGHSGPVTIPPGGHFATAFGAEGGYKVTVTTATGSARSDVLVASELPRGHACAP